MGLARRPCVLGESVRRVVPTFPEEWAQRVVPAVLGEWAQRVVPTSPGEWARRFVLTSPGEWAQRVVPTSPLTKGGYRGVLRVLGRLTSFAVQAVKNRAGWPPRDVIKFFIGNPLSGCLKFEIPRSRVGLVWPLVRRPNPILR
jgi:hypothetical protein